MPKKVSFFTLFESQMYQTPRRNIPEKTNRTIALLLSVFFISIYFWNFISILIESFPIFYIFNTNISISFWFVKSILIPTLLLLFSTIFSYTHWALIHECVHGNFSNSRNENRFWGRFLCVLFGTTYQIVKTAHLVHHKFNRSEGERIEFIEKNAGPILFQKFLYYVRLFVGTYFLEVSGSFLLSLPLSFTSPIAKKYFSKFPVYKTFFKQIQKPEIVRELRIDSLLIFILFGCAFYLCGPNAIFLILVLILRGWIVSFLDHSYHYGKELDDVNSAYNLYLPKFFSYLFLNFNYHRVHHRFPGCSWNRLPIQFLNSKDQMDLSLWIQSIRQLSGLLILPEKSDPHKSI
ncbi:stearoyl-CoA 9-desaturase [Leptospira noguchii serovar Panama str. CZ214]|uniref:Stearoyl-CoA 9-desaturase n=2 Tax=Leptospira noguchii TaxID=28182 RepID=T0GYP1_9LEPT|nr:stearoyl-CoA 9-desaturase [Leptospira noguchii serovar Panama str. CZ214]